MERNIYLSGSPWESIVVYSRLVKCGPYGFISSTTSIDEKGYANHVKRTQQGDGIDQNHQVAIALTTILQVLVPSLPMSF